MKERVLMLLSTPLSAAESFKQERLHSPPFNVDDTIQKLNDLNHTSFFEKSIYPDDRLISEYLTQFLKPSYFNRLRLWSLAKI